MDVVKQQIINHAKELGFSSVGFATAESMPEEAAHLDRWLEANMHGKMTYMERNRDLRTDPRLLHPGTKTIISLTHNYYYQKDPLPDTPKIAMYAFGRDYHKVLKKKLKALARFMTDQIDKNLNIRYFTDSAPILESDWAKRSGVGWVGKNTLLIHPKMGSFFFLAELLVDMDITPDSPMEDYCGTCTRCIDACPTDAIAKDGYIVDGSKCISYLTIELKDLEIPSQFKGQMEQWAFGCDICQEVCPWNRFANQHTEPDFMPNPKNLALSYDDWELMTKESFEILFEGSPVKRTGLEGMKRNVKFIKKE